MSSEEPMVSYTSASQENIKAYEEEAQRLKQGSEDILHFAAVTQTSAEFAEKYFHSKGPVGLPDVLASFFEGQNNERNPATSSNLDGGEFGYHARRLVQKQSKGPAQLETLTTKEELEDGDGGKYVQVRQSPKWAQHPPRICSRRPTWKLNVRQPGYLWSIRAPAGPRNFQSALASGRTPI